MRSELHEFSEQEQLAIYEIADRIAGMMNRSRAYGSAANPCEDNYPSIGDTWRTVDGYQVPMTGHMLGKCRMLANLYFDAYYDYS